jgi:hypothetical protein
MMSKLTANKLNPIEVMRQLADHADRVDRQSQNTG